MNTYSFRFPWLAALFVGASLVLVPAKAQTQVTTLGGTADGYLGALGQQINATSWFGFAFTTGASSGGYTFNNFTARLIELGGGGHVNPSALLLKSNGSGLVDTSVPAEGTFGITPTALNPATYTNAVFTPTASLTLLPNTTYVLAVTPFAAGSWDWAATSSAATVSSGWSMNAGVIGPYDNGTQTGNSILAGSAGFRFMASIDATPIPEPETTALLAGLAAVGAAMAYRRRKRAV